MNYHYEVHESGMITLETPDYLMAKDHFEKARIVWAEKPGCFKLRLAAVDGDRVFILTSANVGTLDEKMQFV